MNLLIEPLPDAVTVDGEQYPVYTDFRHWVKFELAMLDTEMDDKDRAITALSLCYKRTTPPTLALARDGAISFYSGGQQEQSGNSGGEHRDTIYSFEHDADFIYSAFLTQYGINLTTADLHWYQYRALFKSLNDSNLIVKIMEYRSVDLSKIKDKETREHYRKMKTLYALPKPHTETEKLDKIAEALLNGGDLTGVL